MASIAPATPQLALPVQLPPDARFDSFVAGENTHAAAYMQELAEHQLDVARQFNYLWGRAGSGKSHLLAALVSQFGESEKSAIYLPLREIKNEPAEALLQGLEQFDLIALDDLEAVADDSFWCDALFALYNRVYDSGTGYLLATGSDAVEHISFQLPDLKSRIQAGTVFQLKPLDDTSKVLALQLHSKNRGMELSAAVSEFMVHRLSRDMHELINVLNTLDKASIAEQRRLTLPFVKQVLGI